MATEANAARSSVAVAAGFLIGALLGGLLGLLIAVVVGEGAQTDSFLAAYSVYLIFTLFGSTLRIALVPMMGSPADEAALRDAARDAVGRLMAAGAVLALVLVALSPLLGRVLATGDEGSPTGTASISLAILALASFCQVAAASLSATLAASRRFAASSAIFVAGSAATLVLATGLMVAFGILGAAVGILGGSILLYGAHHVYLRRFGFVVWPALRGAFARPTWGLALTAAAGASVPLTLQAGLTIALSAAAGAIGIVTAYSYAYFVAVILTSITASTIGFVTMPELVAALGRRREGTAGAYLRDTSPICVLLYAPLAAAIAVFGRPPIDAVLAGTLSVATVDLLWDLLRIFLLMGLVWAVLAPVTTLALSLRRFRELAMLAVVILPLQAAVVISLARLGPVEVGIGHAAVTCLLQAGVAIIVFGRGAARACAAALWRAAPALAIAAVVPLVSWLGPADPGPSAATALAIVALVLYAVVAVLAWPAVGGRTFRLLLGRASG